MAKEDEDSKQILAFSIFLLSQNSSFEHNSF